MPRTCTICRHSSREAINKALIQHQPFRAIARQYGTSKDALIRHHDNHLPATLLKAQEADDIAHADALLAHVEELRTRALGILQAAEKDSDHRNALGAIREARGCLELLGKLAGQLQANPAASVD